MYRAVLMAAALAIGVSPADEALVKTLSTPMWSVVKLITADKWDPRIDDLLQRFPGAQPLGAKWNASAPAWQKARSALSTRLTKVLDAYRALPEFTNTLRTELETAFSSAEAAELAKVIGGPAGPALLNFEGRKEYVAAMMPATPDGPSPGDPAWSKALAGWSQKYQERIGAAKPAMDAAQEKEMLAFISGPLGRKFSMLWMSVVGKATNAVDGGINLMIFDDRDAITKEINQAIASMK